VLSPIVSAMTEAPTKAFQGLWPQFVNSATELLGSGYLGNLGADRAALRAQNFAS
jgi:hypothetical protein